MQESHWPIPTKVGIQKTGKSAIDRIPAQQINKHTLRKGGNDRREPVWFNVYSRNVRFTTLVPGSTESGIIKPFVVSLSNHNGALRQAQGLPRT